MIERRFRRLRWFAACLLVLSPPVGGILLPALDPCPIDLPWLAQTGSSHQHDHSGAGSQSPSGHHSVCHCVGTCAGAGGLVAAPAQPGTPHVALEAHEARPHRFAAAVQVAKPRFLLPPATAPPLV